MLGLFANVVGGAVGDAWLYSAVQLALSLVNSAVLLAMLLIYSAALLAMFFGLGFGNVGIA